MLLTTVDVNECLHENPCLPSEQCENTEGSYRCIGTDRITCYSGYRVSSSGTSCVGEYQKMFYIFFSAV